LNERFISKKETTECTYLPTVWSYWTEVHQIYLRCSQIITDELLKIGMAILQPVSKCQSYE